jgi:hypothetical protein
MMSVLSRALILVLLLSSYAVSQDPVSVVSSRWFRTVKPVQKPSPTAGGPSRPMSPDDKYFQRTARAARTDNPQDPYQESMDGRSAAIDKAVQESRTPKADDVTGYTYIAEMQNDSGKTIAVVFWEYEFVEIANPANVVRRQFLCALKIKTGERQELSAFTLHGPSDSVAVESLAKSSEKLFNEKAQINRIELSDGAIMQRHDWKFADVKEAVKRATSTPWGKETCRAL